MSKAEKRSVKNILINKPLQREFTIVIIGVMMAAAFFVGVLIRIVILDLTQGVPNTISRYNFEQMMADASAQLIGGSVVIIFIAVIATGFLGVFFLHRVAGPVYRFGQILKRIARGEVPDEIQLRPRDFFKETAEDINHVIKFLKKRDNAIQQVNDSVNEIELDKLPHDVQDRLRHIRSTVNQISKSSS